VQTSEAEDAYSDRVCPNCGSTRVGKYCADCGQRYRRRLDWSDLTSSFLSYLTDLDSPFLRTMVGLTLRPGHLVREYVEGQRQPYVTPLRFAFFGATASALAVTLFGLNPFPGSVDHPPEVQRVLDFLIVATPYFALAVLILGCVPMRYLFPRRDRNSLECAVLLCYWTGYNSWIYAFTMPHLGDHVGDALLPFRGVFLVYLLWMIAQFYENRNWWTWVGGLLTIGVLIVMEFLVGMLFIDVLAPLLISAG